MAVPGAERAQEGLCVGAERTAVLRHCLFPMSGSSPTALTFFVAVALTNLEDLENAKRAYAEAVRLDK